MNVQTSKFCNISTGAEKFSHWQDLPMQIMFSPLSFMLHVLS